MNKKLLKSIMYVASGIGITTSIPFTTSSCSFSVKQPTELKCDTNIEDISQDFGAQVDSTPILNDKIYTDTGAWITKDVTFTCEGLTEQTGLNIDRITGVISGVPTRKPTNPEFKIKFTANVDGKSLQGYTNTFTITVNPTKLVCDSDTIPDNITGNVDASITPTASLSGHIKTDTGESVSNVTFSCEGLPSGLVINETTGVISGNPTEETSSQQFVVTFTASIDGKTLTGQIDKFTISIGPKIPSSLTSDVRVYDEIRSTSINVFTEELSGHIKTDTGVVVNKAEHGLRFTLSQGTLPSGLSFSSDTGVISGKCTTIGTYKFKITADATVYGVALSYETDEFSITISNTILPDTIYKYEDTSKTILAGFTDQFINDSSAYSSCDTMQIPTRATSIVDSAFLSKIPTFIKKLTFAEGSQCTSIGSSAFEGSNLNSVDLSNATKLFVINSNAFNSCSALTSVLLPNGLTIIGDGVFGDCQSLISVNFPSSLESIGRYCFYQCFSIRSLDLTNCTNLKQIGDGAFQQCNSSNFTSIILPSNIETIGGYAFYLCSSLTSVDLSMCTKLTNIGRIAFKGCLLLKIIRWNLPVDYSTTVTISTDNVFENMPTGGIFECSTSGINLNNLKTWLGSYGFPTDWTFIQ